VFDSGIGGLTVVRALRELVPEEDIVYLGDTARLPYGTKSAEVVGRFALEDAEFLLEQGVRLVVVACHSASSVALAELERHCPVPVVGVIEPGARAVVAATRSRRVAVIGTALTIAAGAYERAIRAAAEDVRVVAKATPLFVPLAEEGWLENEVAEAAARRYLEGLAGGGIDALLLGCTHFPLLSGVISRVVGKGVAVVDSSAETARAVAELLGEMGPGGRGFKGSRRTAGGASQGRCRFYLTDLAPGFRSVAERFLGSGLEDVARATVGG